LSWVQYVTVQNVDSGHNGVWGIFTDFSNYLTFDNVECHHSGTQHGIYISNCCGNEIIQNSRFHDNSGAGIHHNGDLSEGDGIPPFVAGEIVNSTIRYNKIWNNGVTGGAGINLDGVSQSFIYNNLLYNNLAGGIVNYAGDGINPGSNVIVQNTVYFSAAAGRYGVSLTDNSGNNVVGNNILITAENIHFAIVVEGAGTGNNIDYNAVWTPDTNLAFFSTDGSDGLTAAQWVTAGYGSHSVILSSATGDFNNAAADDFSEATGAATINAGSSTFATVNSKLVADMNGQARVAGKIDIGAYQFGSGPGDGSDGGDGTDGDGTDGGGAAASLSSFLTAWK